MDEEELLHFFQDGLSQDFGCSDDHVIECLRISMEELRHAGLDLPPPRGDNSELPMKHLGVIIPPTIEQLINSKYDVDDQMNTVSNRLTIPPDGGPVVSTLPRARAASMSGTSSGNLSRTISGDWDASNDDLSVRASSVRDDQSDVTSVVSDMNDIGNDMAYDVSSETMSIHDDSGSVDTLNGGANQFVAHLDIQDFSDSDIENGPISTWSSNNLWRPVDVDSGIGQGEFSLSMHSIKESQNESFKDVSENKSFRHKNVPRSDFSRLQDNPKNEHFRRQEVAKNESFHRQDVPKNTDVISYNQGVSVITIGETDTDRHFTESFQRRQNETSHLDHCYSPINSKSYANGNVRKSSVTTKMVEDFFSTDQPDCATFVSPKQARRNFFNQNSYEESAKIPAEQFRNKRTVQQQGGLVFSRPNIPQNHSMRFYAPPPIQPPPAVVQSSRKYSVSSVNSVDISQRSNTSKPSSNYEVKSRVVSPTGKEVGSRLIFPSQQRQHDHSYPISPPPRGVQNTGIRQYYSAVWISVGFHWS